MPAAVGDFMMLDAIRASGGRAVAGREAAIGPWMGRAGSAEGISICPETAVCFDVLERLAGEGWVAPDEEVVVFNTGAAQKYLEALPLDLPRWTRIGISPDRSSCEWANRQRQRPEEASVSLRSLTLPVRLLRSPC